MRALKVTVGVAALILAGVSLLLLRGMSQEARPVMVVHDDPRISQVTKDNIHQLLRPEHVELGRKHAHIPTRQPHPPGPLPATTTISYIDATNAAELDRRWLPLLQTADVIEVKRLSSGLSEKWRVTLEGGYMAAVKPCEDPLYIRNHTEWTTIDYYQMKKPYGTRTGRMDQGMGEIAGYHLDRALGMNRKPPIAGRLLSSRLLYGTDADAEHDERLQELRAAPEFFVPVAMVAWMDPLVYWLPPEHHGKILKHARDIPTEPRELKLVREVSEAILFDFLADDHDRRRVNGNWVRDANGTLLLWDSGIAWLHGPEGRKSRCYEILCGPDSFIEDPEKRCTHISRFSRSFVHKLREMVLRGESLGEKWIDSMSQDLLSPVFERYAKFYWKTGQRSTQRPVHFTEDNMKRGMDSKVAKLLEHIDEKEKKYGNVLF